MTRERGGWILAGLLLLASIGPPSHAQQLRGLPVSCTVAISTATAQTAVGGDCAAKPGLTLWITDINFSTNAAGIASGSFNSLVYGTGSACATGTVLFWAAMTPAATQATVIQSFATPMRLPANVDLCWINSSAGTKFAVITGYYTP